MKDPIQIGKNLPIGQVRHHTAALVTRLGFDYSLCIVLAILCELYWHPVLYLLTLMIIAARLVGIGSVAIHDGAHQLITRNQRTNDVIVSLIGTSVCAPIY